MKTNRKDVLIGSDELERRTLQEYIFALEEVQEKAEELSLEHKKLQHSQSLLTAILSGTQNGIALVKNRKMSWFNKGFTDIFGWSLEELVGKSIRVFYPNNETYIKMGKKIYGDLIHGKLPKFEYDFIHKNGQHIPCIVTGCTLDKNDLSKGFIFSFTDIAERKKAEKALRESEKNYRMLVDNLPAVVFKIYKDWTVDFIDNKIKELTGYSKEEFDSKKIKWSDLIFEQDLEIVKKGFLDSRKNKNKSCVNEYRIRNKEGKVLWIQSRRQMMYGENGKFQYASGVIFDISNRKKYEENLKNSKEAAEAASRAKSEFLANMSHELRTPLSHIIGFTELVVDKQFGDLNETQNEYLNDVLQSSKHLLSLINDILDISKIEAGKLELNSTDVNLKNLVENSLIMVKEKTMKHRIKLTTQFELIPESIKADELKLKQIIYNLLSNAVKFTPDDGLISIHTRLSSSGNFVETSVIDTGIGLNSEDLERIFNPFDQVENFLSKKHQGTGLGLSIAKKFVELHGGKIWAESKGKGKGSKFSFLLPV